MITAALALFTYGCSDSGTREEDAGARKWATEVGAKAPPFTVDLFGGGVFDLGKFEGTPVVVNFWASWCGPCKYEAPLLDSVYREYGPRGVVFIGVAVQDVEESATAFIKKYGVGFPNGLDRTGEIMRDYDIFVIPRTFVIDGDGAVSYAHSGPISEEGLSAAIEKVL